MILKQQSNLLYPIKHNPPKRIFDFIFSIFILFFLSPLYLLIMLLVYFSSPGPIFYISLRLGRGGKIIQCLKFRTMYSNAEDKLLEMLKYNSELKKEWTKYQKIKNDPRITPFGRFLRKTSLDELPQFFNVLKGDLSIVGPRPFVLVGPKEYYHQEIKKYLGDKTEKILSIRPGITGIWQTSGRSDISIEERINLEVSYIENQSFLKDLLLICKTIPKIFFPSGAY